MIQSSGVSSALLRCTFVLTIGCSVTLAVAGQEPLTEAQVKEAVAIGKDCSNVPLVRVGAVRGDFNVFIEGPFARIAIHAAAARQMHQRFDASKVTGDVAARDYRVWAQYTLRGRRTVSVNHVVLQPNGKSGMSAAIQPVRERSFQLTVGQLPAHGIVDEVRWRNWEWIFDHLPVGTFQVILETSAGAQRYTVTGQDQATLMRVCT
jgi:hypothetical protein